MEWLFLIDDDLWQAVKARQGNLKVPKRPKPGEPGFWDRRRPRYLLSGLVKCGRCGGGYSMISQTLMGCSTARNKGTCSNRLNIRREALEATILAGLRLRLMEPDLVKVFAEAFIAETNKLRAAQTQQVKDSENRLQQIERRIHKLVTAIAEGEPANGKERAAMAASRCPGFSWASYLIARWKTRSSGRAPA